jgi:betaine-aldehyde dehydrogenase
MVKRPLARKWKMFIGGEWREAESGATYKVDNPATAELIAEVPMGDTRDAKSAVDAARDAFDSGPWPEKTPNERAALLWRFADVVEKHLSVISRTETIDVGKTIKYSRDNDLPFIIDNLRFFAGAARALQGEASGEYTGLGTSIMRREPIGVVSAIVPWNYPLYIAVWKLAPAIAAGNTVVLKPASITPLSLLEFVKYTQKLFPKGVINVVTGPGESVGAELASNLKVDMVALTGDVSTGKRIMQLASSNVKRVHLELGGKAPFIVLPDADIDAATEGAVVSAFWNSGQDCTAATRVYVHEKMHDRFVKLLAQKIRRIRVGDPMKESTDMGPLISERQREKVEYYVESGARDGAKLLVGGERPKMPRVLENGYFYAPTLIDSVSQDMKINQEEIFGPVLCVLKYRTVDEAIEKSNGVVYGLAASVWGRDITTLFRVARKLRFGTVWVNEHGVLVSEMPHGGYKQSGFGKDLGLRSFDDYTQVKHVYVDQTGMVRKPWYYMVYGDKP